MDHQWYRIKPRPRYEIEFAKPLGAIPLLDGPDHLRIELRAILFVFGKRPAELEEVANLPARLATAHTQRKAC